jgi:hypothetical protein
MRILPIVLAIGSLLLPNFSQAWGTAGHMVIAAEAYQQLSPEDKAQVFEVLKAHPDFAKWSAAYHANSKFDLPAYVFMRSSSWPDEIRRTENPYDHPEWHFIDYPLRPPEFPFEPDPRPTNNVLYGLQQSEQTLADTNASPELRAVYLSWLIHLVGDIHQPLHCASFYGANYPEGDRGGNDFFVKPGPIGVRLHGIWDGLLGSSLNPRIAWNYAVELDAKFPKTSLPELTRDLGTKSWSLESRELAIKYGYWQGRLPGATNEAAAPLLPTNYLKQAKTVAEKQGALAGYRLADDIQHYLKWSHAVPLLPENTNVASNLGIPRKIGAMEADKHYDEEMIVTGKVAQVTSRPSVVFINLDQAGPQSPFTAIIFQDNLSSFGDVQSFQGKNVEISGFITEYHKKPEVILDSASQLKVVVEK